MKAINDDLWSGIEVQDMESREEFAASVNCVTWCFDCICFTFHCICISCF